MPAHKPAASKAALQPRCPTCRGSGEGTVTVTVGRKRRKTDDQQLGLCPACLGSGEHPTP